MKDPIVANRNTGTYRYPEKIEPSGFDPNSKPDAVKKSDPEPMKTPTALFYSSPCLLSEFVDEDDSPDR